MNKKFCSRCGIEIKSTFDTCRNTAACERRAEGAARDAMVEMFGEDDAAFFEAAGIDDIGSK